MAATTTESIQASREAVVKAHIEAEARETRCRRDVSRHSFTHGTRSPHFLQLLTVRPRFTDLSAPSCQHSRDFYLHVIELHHAEKAVIVEARFGGTQRGVWAGIEPTGKPMEVQVVLMFMFEGSELVCEKVYFDHATILRQLGVMN